MGMSTLTTPLTLDINQYKVFQETIATIKARDPENSLTLGECLMILCRTYNEVGTDHGDQAQAPTL